MCWALSPKTIKTVKETSNRSGFTKNIAICPRRFERYETEGHIGTYVHGDGQIAIMVDMEGGDDVLAKIFLSKLLLPIQDI